MGVVLLGSIVEPLLCGHLADRTGFGPAMCIGFVVQMIAVAMPALGVGLVGLMVSSIVVGVFTSGIVPLVLGRVNELLAHHPAAQKGVAWRTATTSFAVMQALAAYGLSFVFFR